MDKYLTYRIEDYLTDDEFINSISELEHDHHWSKWLKENPGPAETYYEAKKLIVSLKFKEEEFLNKDSVWDRIDSNTEAKSIDISKASRPTRYLWMGGAIAAGLVLLFISFYQNDNLSVTDTPGFVQEEMILPADSKISNISGEITFERDNWNEERRVQLEGTATFDVTKGVPFIVETPTGSVRVLGTKFTVTSENDAFSVDVEHGKVRVTSGNNSQVLTANMSYRKNVCDVMY